MFQKYFAGIDIHNDYHRGTAEFEVALLQNIISLHRGGGGYGSSIIGEEIYSQWSSYYGKYIEVSGYKNTKYNEQYLSWSLTVTDNYSFPGYIGKQAFSDFARYYGQTNQTYAAHLGYKYPPAVNADPYAINLLFKLLKESDCVRK